MAKAHENNPNIAERFEFFVNKVELINAYSELNNPEEQKIRFLEQTKLNKNWEFDDEIHSTDEDYLEAMKWYKLAAEQGDASAQVFLGHMCEKGLGVSPNDQEAFKWYKLAA